MTDSSNGYIDMPGWSWHTTVRSSENDVLFAVEQPAATDPDTMALGVTALATPLDTTNPTQTRLTPVELAAVRQSLEGEVVRLHVELAAAQQEIGTDFAGEVGMVGDLADHSSLVGDLDANASLASNARQVLAQAELALQRIAAGRYGQCDSCGLAIGKERLQALPRASLCLACQQRHGH